MKKKFKSLYKQLLKRKYVFFLSLGYLIALFFLVLFVIYSRDEALCEINNAESLEDGIECQRREISSKLELEEPIVSGDLTLDKGEEIITSFDNNYLCIAHDDRNGNKNIYDKGNIQCSKLMSGDLGFGDGIQFEDTCFSKSPGDDKFLYEYTLIEREDQKKKTSYITKKEFECENGCSDGACISGKLCSEESFWECSSNEFCDLSVLDDNGNGKCVVTPSRCDNSYKPVCAEFRMTVTGGIYIGSYFRTYSNDCERQKEKALLAYEGKCKCEDSDYFGQDRNLNLLNFNEFEDGYVELQNGKRYYDKCLDKNTVREYYCDENGKATAIDTDCKEVIYQGQTECIDNACRIKL